MITINDVQTLLSDAATLIAAGDYSGAIDKALAAQTLLAGIPNTEDNGQKMEFRESIDAVIRNCRQRTGSRSGIRTVQVVERR